MSFDEDPREQSICEYCDTHRPDKCDGCEHAPKGEPADDIAVFDEVTITPDQHLIGRVELNRRTFPASGPVWDGTDPKELLESLAETLREMDAEDVPRIWQGCTMDDIINLPVSDKYAKTAGREVSFCPMCGFRWWQPHERKNILGNHIARWECRPCNIKITRVSNGEGIREFIESILIYPAPIFTITGRWSI